MSAPSHSSLPQLPLYSPLGVRVRFCNPTPAPRRLATAFAEHMPCRLVVLSAFTLFSALDLYWMPAVRWSSHTLFPEGVRAAVKRSAQPHTRYVRKKVLEAVPALRMGASQHPVGNGDGLSSVFSDDQGNISGLDIPGDGSDSAILLVSRAWTQHAARRLPAPQNVCSAAGLTGLNCRDLYSLEDLHDVIDDRGPVPRSSDSQELLKMARANAERITAVEQALLLASNEPVRSKAGVKVVPSAND